MYVLPRSYSYLDKDQDSHGTSVAGVAASNCIYTLIGASSVVRKFHVGVAPGASLVIFHVSYTKVLTPQTQFLSHYLQSLTTMLMSQIQ